jgi:AcrR family transcriptional regulator
VPKRVDHQERRRQIADALLRVAAARGLHATGMREVAAEAGVSLRLVQYYFGTKEELMLFATQQLAARFGERGMARISRLKETGSPVHPRDVIAAILAEALPADDEMRTFYVIYTAYLALSLTDPALAIAPLVKNSGAVTGVITAQLRAAQAAGDTPAPLDPDLEAFSLMAMSAGLATSVVAGQSSAEQAQAVIDYHLDRLFPPSRPALRGSTTRRPPGSALTKDAAVTACSRRRRSCRPLPHPVPQDEMPGRTDRSRATHAEQDDLRAPRGALLYSPRSGQGLEEVSLDLMADP